MERVQKNKQKKKKKQMIRWHSGTYIVKCVNANEPNYPCPPPPPLTPPPSPFSQSNFILFRNNQWFAHVHDPIPTNCTSLRIWTQDICPKSQKLQSWTAYSVFHASSCTLWQNYLTFSCACCCARSRAGDGAGATPALPRWMPFTQPPTGPEAITTDTHLCSSFTPQPHTSVALHHRHTPL